MKLFFMYYKLNKYSLAHTSIVKVSLLFTVHFGSNETKEKLSHMVFKKRKEKK